MGWFEDQVKARKKYDKKTFEDAFMSLAGLDNNNKDDLSEIEKNENFAIKQILSFYRVPMMEIPSTMVGFKNKMDYALGQAGILSHTVELTDAYVREKKAPLLIYTIVNELPVVLFPNGKDAYYYVNYKTGKKVKIDASLVHGLEMEALSFYRPLPDKKITLKEYAKYIRDSVRIMDVVFMILLMAVSSGVGLLLPYLTRMLTGDVVSSKNINQFIIVSVYVVSTATGLLLIRSAQSFFNSRVSIKIEKSVQEATMMRVLSLPTSFFKKYNTGELTARFSSVNRLASIILSGVFMTGLSVIMSLAYLFQLVSFAPSLIAPVLLVLVVESGFTILISFLQKNHTRKQLKLASQQSGVTYEMINGIQKIRLSGSEKRVFAKWAAAYSKTAKTLYNPPLILRLSQAISLSITLIGNIVIYYVAARNNIDAANYMAFVSSYGVLSSAFSSIGQMIGVISTIQPIFDMARPILESEPESKQGKKVIESISGNIQVKNASFRYNEKGPLIVNNLSLDIKEGEYVAIVGKTGCGKSTLVRLLLGFEEPSSGEILYDGININEVDLSSLRKNIGTVMQNGTLFHADIYSNIIISCPTLGEEEAWVAAEIANIADDIREMPMGMKTVISEGQGGISGGQKQRIMIARAIVHKPKVLIFDEATSALDNKTQRSISDSITRLNCTRIVIAHRLSTIKNADRIIMLEGGKIIEEGDYQSLIDKKGKFAELVDRQRLDNNN